MPSPIATYVPEVPPDALRCANGKLKVPAPSAPVAILLAKMDEFSDVSEMVWKAILGPLEANPQLVADMSALTRPRVIFTIDGPAQRKSKGKTWRIPFTAYLLDMRR